jgi:hypothetical protein
MTSRLLLVLSAASLIFVSCASQSTPTVRPIGEKLAEVDTEGFALKYSVPGMDEVTMTTVEYHEGLFMDIYYPPGSDFQDKKPVVILVLGFTNEQMQNWFGLDRLRNLGQYPTLGQVVAAHDMIAVAYDVAFAEDNLNDVLGFLAANGSSLGMDASRIAIWSCSGNSSFALRLLADENHPHSTALRCGVVAYPVLHEYIGYGNASPPALPSRPRADMPILFVKVDEANEEWGAAVDTYLDMVEPLDIPMEVIYYEGLPHGFDGNKNTRTSQETKAIINRMMTFMKEHLAG